MIAGLLPRFWSVGAPTRDLGPARLTYRSGLEDEPTATFLHDLTPRSPAELDTALERAALVTGSPCPRVFVDSRTPAVVEATLVARDWSVEPMLQLVLTGESTIRPAPDTSIRPAGDGDWTELTALFRADHCEEDDKFGRPVRPPEHTQRIVEARRRLPEPVRYFVATGLDGRIVGFVAGWPGDAEHGLIEDLFVAADHRGHGLATALIAQALRWARPPAGAVVIGAEPDDTPKHLYHRLGFRPVEMLRSATPPAR